ncbi:hypothetical protein HZH68_017078 [Vespula germanica]|uniref:Peptidase M12B domain-containing protein n=1 Tax=Vespula germanica TaxID=30212 RepID=A0A834MQJ0_VESGE|nr:hypothetical protein HZH68_017078 [Vespula germanica]
MIKILMSSRTRHTECIISRFGLTKKSDGNIGSELVIRPLPERVIQEIVNKNISLMNPTLLPNVTNAMMNDLNYTSHHVVYKKYHKPIDDEYSDYALMEPDHLAKKYRKKRSLINRSKREAPYVIYPEILCIVDYDGYRYKNELNHYGKVMNIFFWEGFAYVGGACVVNKRLEKVNSVAIIEDTGGFSGIIVAAHEVGHLLGAVHDGSPPPSYLGGPGAEKCRWEDGYIMSDLRHTEKGFKWSHCSVSSFHHFLNGDTATCLYNAPHEDEALPRVLPGKLLSLDAQCRKDRVLPGKLLSLDAQCRKDRGTSACFKDDRVCAQLFCFDAGSGYCVAYRPAAEGSPCGDGQYCLNGKCVAEHENIIPDYTQNIPTYVRRDGSFGPPANNRPIFAQYNNTDYRYPWEGTTYTSPKSKFKYSPYITPNLLTSSTTTTTTTTTTNLKRQYTPTSTVYKYTYTTANNLLAINDKIKNNSNYNNNNNNNNFGKINNGVNRTTTTSKKNNRYNFNFRYNVNSTPKVVNNPNDVNYPKIIPFKRKTTPTVTPFSPTTLALLQNGLQNGQQNGGRGKRIL